MAGHVQRGPGRHPGGEPRHDERHQPAPPIVRREHGEARGEDGGEREGLDEQGGDERQRARPHRPPPVAEHRAEHAQRHEQLHERVRYREQSILLERREIEKRLRDERGAGGRQPPAGVEDHQPGPRRRQQRQQAVEEERGRRRERERGEGIDVERRLVFQEVGVGALPGPDEGRLLDVETLVEVVRELSELHACRQHEQRGEDPRDEEPMTRERAPSARRDPCGEAKPHWSPLLGRGRSVCYAAAPGSR